MQVNNDKSNVIKYGIAAGAGTSVGEAARRLAPVTEKEAKNIIKNVILGSDDFKKDVQNVKLEKLGKFGNQSPVLKTLKKLVKGEITSKEALAKYYDYKKPAKEQFKNFLKQVQESGRAFKKEVLESIKISDLDPKVVRSPLKWSGAGAGIAAGLLLLKNLALPSKKED